MTPKAHAVLTHPVTERDHVEGSPSAAVTLVEYGDFQCPHCGHAFPIVEALRKTLGEDLRFVFRHFPLSEIHEHAELAAEAAEAASAQGKFWEMHHLLFKNQAQLDVHHVQQYASRLGLDMKLFADALASRTYQRHVREDFMGGARSGVNGTPTFFINGGRYDGMPMYDELLEALQARIDG